MEDDQFIREVNEELREDRLKQFWDKYKVYIIGAAVLVVAGTAGYRGWEYYTKTQAASSGDRFIEAIALSDDDKHDEAIAKLEALGRDGFGQYPALAKLRIASELADAEKFEEAISAYDEIAADGSFNEAFQSVARLRAGLLLVDHGDLAEVEAHLSDLATAGKPFRHSAREGLGLAYFKAAELKKAYAQFKAISDDTESAGGARSRATLMLELLAGKGVTSAE